MEVALLSIVYTPNENIEDCAICQENFQLFSIVTKLECEHLFHTDCISEWFKNASTCPLCRNEDIFAEINKFFNDST